MPLCAQYDYTTHRFEVNMDIRVLMTWLLTTSALGQQAHWEVRQKSPFERHGLHHSNVTGRFLTPEGQPVPGVRVHLGYGEPRPAMRFRPARRFPRRWKNTLFSAGEATETQGHASTVHGAIASGIRAASQASA